MRTILFYTGLLLSCFGLNAQDIFEKGRYCDTTVITGKKVSVELIWKYKTAKKLERGERINDRILANTADFLEFLKKDIRELLPEISKFKAIQIEFIYGLTVKGLKVKEITPIIEFNGGYALMSQQKHPNICTFQMNNESKVNIYFATLDDLLNFDFKKIFQQVELQPVETHWYPERFEFRLRKDSIVLEKVRFSSDMYLSSLDLNYGLSLIKQTPTIDFGFGMSLILEKEDSRNYRYLQQKIKLNYGYVSQFDETAQKLRLNGFFTTGYSLNIPRSRKWIGIEAGYLAHRNGGMFEKNTVVLGLSLAGGQFDFTPKVYLSKGPVFMGFSLNLIGW